MKHIDSLKIQVDALGITYHKVKLPIYNDYGDTFTFTFNQDKIGMMSNALSCKKYFKLTKYGAGYLSERVKSQEYGWFTKQRREGKFRAIQNEINAYAPQMKTQEWILACIHGNEIVGTLTEYNAVSHHELLDKLVAAGLEDNCRGWVDDLEMVVNVNVASKTLPSYGDLMVHMRVTNGHGGQVALRYRVHINALGYEYEGRIKAGRKRHLCNVRPLVDEIKENVEEVKNLKVVDLFQACAYTTARAWLGLGIKKLTKREDQIINWVDNAAGRGEFNNAIDLMMFVGNQGGVKGYAKAAKRLLDPVVKNLLEDDKLAPVHVGDKIVVMEALPIDPTADLSDMTEKEISVKLSKMFKSL